MQRLSLYGALAAQILMSIVFSLNAMGIVDQTIPTKEMVGSGIPAELVPL
jgi:hypothetical protein